MLLFMINDEYNDDSDDDNEIQQYNDNDKHDDICTIIRVPISKAILENVCIRFTYVQRH